MTKNLLASFILLFSVSILFAQKQKINSSIVRKDSIAPVGIIKNLSDSELLDVVQRQTFRFFWHGAHPVSGLALERDNTVHAEYYWDYINEAYDEPNFSKTTFGPDAGAIGGTGFGIMAIITAVNRNFITHILQRIEYDALRRAVIDVSFNRGEKFQNFFFSLV